MLQVVGITPAKIDEIEISNIGLDLSWLSPSLLVADRLDRHYYLNLKSAETILYFLFTFSILLA